MNWEREEGDETIERLFKGQVYRCAAHLRGKVDVPSSAQLAEAS